METNVQPPTLGDALRDPPIIQVTIHSVPGQASFDAAHLAALFEKAVQDHIETRLLDTAVESSSVHVNVVHGGESVSNALDSYRELFTDPYIRATAGTYPLRVQINIH